MTYTEQSCVDRIKEITKARNHVIEAEIVFDDEDLENMLEPSITVGFHKGHDLMLKALDEALIVQAEYLEDAERNERIENAQ